MWPASASAGAWVAEEDTHEIWTSVVGERNDGRVVESALYVEAPLFDDTALVVAPWFERSSDTLDGWRAEAALGVKRSVFDAGPVVMSFQGGAVWMSHPPIACSNGGADLRWLGGAALSGAFVSIEAGRRFLSGGCDDDRAEITLGYQPDDRWLALGQIFYDGARDAGETVRLQLSVVRYSAWNRGLQMGLRGRIDGGPAEPAVVIALWGRRSD